MRIVFFDLECGSLRAMMGKVLCCSFLEWDKEKKEEVYVFRGDERKYKGKTKIDDGALCVAIRDELEKYDCIVGHNIRMFDIPFLNARLAKVGERPLHTHFVVDTLYYVKGNAMKIGSGKLDNVAKYFHLGEQKTDIEWDQWQLAEAGDKAAMEYIVEHNIQDVKVLRELWPIVLPYVATIHR